MSISSTSANPFGESYARLYDCVYAAKDYSTEVDNLVRVLRANGITDGARLLDYGCGTGRHAIELASRGYIVTGVDISPAMIAIARERCGVKVDILSVVELPESESTFDAVVSMFDVFSYMTEIAPAISFLDNLRRHCKPEGVVIFDTWHLAGLIYDPPKFSTRSLICPDGSSFVRATTPKTDWFNGVSTLDISFTPSDETDQDAISERHTVRSWTATELRCLAMIVGLDVQEIVESPGLRDQANESHWHVAVVAKSNKNAHTTKPLMMPEH
jgi:SAM-dependent methyltransferase